MNRPRPPIRISTGIAGLDAILLGGLPKGRTYLVRGRAGTGKTTLALQFALEGIRNDERSALFVSLAESIGELTEVADTHGWSLEGMAVQQVVERPDAIVEEAQSTLFHPSEVQLGQIVESIVDRVRTLKPGRVVIDSVAELRLLADSPMRFRRQILALKQLFADLGTTALLLDETEGEIEHQLESICHGVLALEQQAPVYGPERRRLRVVKVRGLKYLGGFHDFEIVTGGLTVYPRLVEVGDTDATPSYECISTRVPGLDRILGGGVERGATVLFLGPAGVGKSALLSQMLHVLAEEGIASLLHVCDERLEMFHRRAENLGLPTRRHQEDGRLILRQLDPGDMSPGKLMQEVRMAVERGGVGAVAFDSLGGLARAMYDDPSLELRMRELLTWLSRRGVFCLLTVSQSGLVGQLGHPQVDLSYLADTVMLLRHFELNGEVRKAISVMKRRSGSHDRTIRELLFGPEGIVVGPPLRELRGILSPPAEVPDGQAEKENGWPG